MSLRIELSKLGAVRMGADQRPEGCLPRYRTRIDRHPVRPFLISFSSRPLFWPRFPPRGSESSMRRMRGFRRCRRRTPADPIRLLGNKTHLLSAIADWQVTGLDTRGMKRPHTRRSCGGEFRTVAKWTANEQNRSLNSTHSTFRIPWRRVRSAHTGHRGRQTENRLLTTSTESRTGNWRALLADKFLVEEVAERKVAGWGS